MREQTHNGMIQCDREPAPIPGVRPRVAGKFLWTGDRKLYLRGVTYGTFGADADGHQFGTPAAVDRDFAAMAASGVNAVRTYTVPPAWLLDAALRAGIWVLVGLPWEQHVAFLDGRERGNSIEQRLRAGVASCAGHPAVLGYSIGNEIPAPIVRWHGRRRVERFLRRLYRAAKAEDPQGLVTYVNFPSTEYLSLPFLDFVSYNVYLEDRESLAAYLARLQSLAGEKPLVMAEIGLDSRRHGITRQARVLDWQVRTAFAGGAAGAFVFAWTDEWHRGGEEIEDWDFGLTDRGRRPKPALAAVAQAYADAPFPRTGEWPRVSVVVCTYNGAATLAGCLRDVTRLDYPDYEVIVVDDGSTDASAQIAGAFDVELVRTENRGLSAARNTGLERATGRIVAYVDDDARPDPDWLTYLAATFLTTDHAGVGGPNLAVPEDGPMAAAVANAPGGPTHVLLSDTVAEHIPGCNMAFWRDRLASIGGFDEQFRVAGDDVDVCWHLQARGWTLGFHPAAVVWHHRRSSLRGFWRQQRGYGRAEALLERKWPEKYNVPGHATWGGRLYGRGLKASPSRWRVYYGVWGSGAFQKALAVPAPVLTTLAGTPEWYLVIALLAAATALGALWAPLLLVAPLLGGAIAALAWQAASGAVAADHGRLDVGPIRRFGLHALTFLLHLAQPAARLVGRLGHGLAPWRRPVLTGFTLPRVHAERIWDEDWHAPEERLGNVEQSLRGSGARVRRGTEFDRWELSVTAGALGGVRLRAVLEEHGRGHQLMRCRIWPRVSRSGLLAILLLTVLAVAAAGQGAWGATAVLGALLAGLVLGAVRECGAAAASSLAAVRTPVPAPPARAAVAAVPVPATDRLPTPEPFGLWAASTAAARPHRARLAPEADLLPAEERR